MSGLVATKFHRPSIPAKWVYRPHLRQRLNEGLELHRQITLVSAPAGFGKTTCISEWVNSLNDMPIAWLSLELSDDDPGRFFVYFFAAMQQVEANLGQEIEAVIRSGTLPPSEIISTTLINDILTIKSRFLLVLDDFHVIQDHFILQVLAQIIANFPDPLHLVLITREDPPLPLARMRANNQLTEVRARDLRFTQADTSRFMNGVMGLSLSQADITSLEHKTEGWIAGLQLVGLSIQDQVDPSSFIAALSGSHRFILSYLTEQVLSQQPEEIHQFLLETSILNKLNGGLCDAVCGRTGSSELLERLLNANLFLISLDEAGQWYRYHHLFADLLRDLQNTSHQGKTAELHRRASHWYASTGMMNDAIQHALAAEDYPMAVDLLEKHSMEMIMQGYANTVNAWVQSLPEEWISQSPRTNLAFAWALILRGAYAQALPYLEQLENTFYSTRVREKDRQSIKAECLVLKSLRINMEGKSADSLALVDQALEIIPKEDHRVYSLAYFGRASAYQAMDQYNHAEKAFQVAIGYGRLSGSLIAEMMSISGLAQLAFELGRLHLAYEITAPAVDQANASHSLAPISTVVFGILGMIYYQWYQTAQARHFLLRALQLSTLGGIRSGMINCHVLLSRLSQVEGDWEAADREIHMALGFLQMETPDYVEQELIAQQVLVYLAQSRPDDAEIALQRQGFSFIGEFSYPELSLQQSISHSLILLYNSSLSLLLYRARNRDDRSGLRIGIKLADQLISWALERQMLLAALEGTLLRAQMYDLLGDHSNSNADYVKALELGKPEGFIGAFVEQGTFVAEALVSLREQNRLVSVPRDYVVAILDAFSTSGFLDNQPRAAGSSANGPVVGLIEPLSQREVEVLRLMIDGLKYKEVAERLFVSLNTVRFHVKTIYGKLNVNNRAQAIEKSRQLHIL
jgi:LuxR family maltose regulon positive regulatory protein